MAEERNDDLIQRMTLPEKVGQLICPLGWEMYTIQGQEVVPSDKFKKLIEECGAGMLWATFRAYPWTRKTLANGVNPELAAKASNVLQADDFAFTNRDYRRVVEPGDFQLMIGAASNDIRLKGLF